MKDKTFLTLIIPCYRQSETIVKNLHKIQETLDATRYSYNIIVVIDGDVDNSFDQIKSEDFHNLVVYQYQQNRGKSYAIRFGMNKAKGEHIMFMDSGLEIDPGGISMLLEHMKWYDADIIVGSKRHQASQVHYTFLRRILSLCYYYFVKILLGVKVKDTQAGIKVFKREVLKKILPRLVEKRFAGDLEMLVVSRHLGYSKIFEAPIKLDYNFSTISSAATLYSIWRIFIDTLAIYYRVTILGYYDSVHHKTILPENISRLVFPKINHNPTTSHHH